MFVDFNILNQLGSPSINSNTFANRPSAGQVGRLFVSTDTFEIYRDTGTGWDLIGGPGSSTVTGSGAAGQVTYWTGTNSVGGENNLWWDAANNHLGINTSTPGVALDVHSAADVGVQLNGTGATPSILQAFLSAGVSQYEIGYNWNSDINYRRFSIYDVQGAKEVISIDQQSRYVGINYQYSSLTDQPAYTLDVSGSVRGADTSYFATNPSTYLLVGSTSLSPTNEALQVTGTAIVSSSVKGASFIPTGNTIPTNGMYLSNTNEISFATNSAQIINVNASGNTGMGIGGTTPASRLHISGDFTQQTSLNIAQQFFIIARKSRGTVASPTTVLVNDEAGGILFSGYDGSNWRSGAGIRAQIQAVSVGSLSSNLQFAAGNGSINGATLRMTMRGDTGNILINQLTDTGERLQVTGTAIVSSTMTAGSFIPSSNTIPTNGMYLSNTNEISFATNSTQIINVNASGNTGMGIGGTTPASRLHVSGDITQQTSLNIPNIFFFIARKSRGTVAAPTTVLVNDEVGGLLFMGYNGTNWAAGASVNAQVQAITGTTTFSCNLRLYAGQGTQNGATLRMTTRGDTGNVLIGTTTDAGQRLQVSGDAYITGTTGIGTATPTEKLTVFGSAILLENGINDVDFKMGITGYGINLQYSTGKLSFLTNNTQRITVDNSGSVGINTNSPTEKLEVNGAIKTAAPTTGTAAAWKLGSRVAAAVVLDATQYIEVEVGGTFYKLAIVT